ncbi:3-deoxy-D-manno-octulosonic acid transferase [Flavicella sediminum]|uniref:3-deoxy-D-manno-octulosonic acid transferase n=1 Tax=Flavicella sediminum TaxID=2585141 RepID=UPI00112268A0|nr:glycosyltransferase N-terminal domain-containing protein [Flavicella sediminum]
MQHLYSIFVFISSFVLRVVAPFQYKIGLFVKGRKHVFADLEKAFQKEDEVLWFHAASLGEFEQGRPVIEKIKQDFPKYKILLTFFSPSGYEVRKDYEKADFVCYLPLDTKRNVHRFFKCVQPKLAVFIKYEFWPNYLSALNKRNIPTFLVSGIFRSNQIFFKSYGKWMRNHLHTFSHFFVQDENSSNLLKTIGFENHTISGDTRFDRVADILKRDNSLKFINEFKADSYTVVAGSTWKEDEVNLVAYINTHAGADEKFIIAPHNIKAEEINALQKRIEKKVVLYSEMKNKELKNYQVFIIDTIGILTKIYSIADVAYVGGGYTKSGIHNVLEPATFGVPIVIGPNYKKFKEASDLIKVGACVATSGAEQLSEELLLLKKNTELRKIRGQASDDFIKSSTGASDSIVSYMKKSL